MSTLNVNNINEAGGVDAVITAGVLDSGSLPAGSILQVVNSVNDATIKTTTSTSFVTTGLSASITPLSTDSKVLIIWNGQVDSDIGGNITIYRDATNLGGGSGNLLTRVDGITVRILVGQSITFLDSPSTTSGITYEVYFQADTGQTFKIRDDSTGPSRLTLLEVAG